MNMIFIRITRQSMFAIAAQQVCRIANSLFGNGYVNVTGNDLYNPHGNGWFYYRVSSEGYNGWNYQINCLMYDGEGRVVWRGDNICGVAADGKLEYGGNVVRIDLQIAPRSIFTQAREFEITVTY